MGVSLDMFDTNPSIHKASALLLFFGTLACHKACFRLKELSHKVEAVHGHKLKLSLLFQARGGSRGRRWVSAETK